MSMNLLGLRMLNKNNAINQIDMQIKLIKILNYSISDHNIIGVYCSILQLSDNNICNAVYFIIKQLIINCKKKQNYLRMGCQSSLVKQPQISNVDDQFTLGYRDFIFNNKGEVFEHYHFSRIISKSMTSIVRKVVHRITKIERVCKIVPLKETRHLIALQEVEMLKQLDHPNIVKIVQYFFQRDYLYIILEYIPGQKIFNEILNFGEINIKDVVVIMRQLLTCIEYCHQNQIAHGSINLENIMLMKNKNTSYLKLIDFSQSHIIGSPLPLQPMLMKRSSSFYAPESVENVTDKQDIWSCGLVLYCLLAGQKPDKSIKKNPKRTLQSRRSPKDSKLMQLAFDLVGEMLSLELKERPTAKKCLTHQFFKITQDQNLQNYQNLFKNLTSLKISQRLTSLFYMYAALNYTSTQSKAEYLNEFYQLDENKDGKLYFDELVKGLQNTYSISKERASEMVKGIFDSLDKNHTGCLQFSQFVMGTVAIGTILSEEALKKLFKEFDLNDNGIIQQDEIKGMIDGIQEFQLFPNQPYQITFNQFIKLMKKVLTESQAKKKQENL